MKAAAFDYTKVSTVDEAVQLLSRHPGSAQILAGGQSLMAMMNLKIGRAHV